MSNKLKTIIVSIACTLVTIALIITIFFLAEINRKLATPTNLMVVDNLPNNEIILQVDENPKAEKYVFSIERMGEKQNLVSLENYISATNCFKEAGLYQVACRVVGKTNGSISDYTDKLEYIVKVKLDTPNIELDLEKNILVFSTVSGATSYELIYGIAESGEIAKLTESRYFGEVGKRYFDLSELTKGSYTLRLLAKGGDCEESDLTEPISYVKKEKLSSPTNIVYDNADKILSFSSSWNSFSVVAYYEGSDLTKVITIEDSNENHVLDLTMYLTDNVYKLEIIALGSDNTYTINSDKVIWQNA